MRAGIVLRECDAAPLGLISFGGAFYKYVIPTGFLPEDPLAREFVLASKMWVMTMAEAGTPNPYSELSPPIGWVIVLRCQSTNFIAQVANATARCWCAHRGGKGHPALIAGQSG